MQRAVTAIYRTHEAASLVRDEVERLGIGRHNITVIPDVAGGVVGAPSDTAGTTTATSADIGYVGTRPGYDDAIAPATHGGATGNGAAGYSGPTDALDDLDLPEEDRRTYRQAIRNGDYVVSVKVDRDEDVARVQDIMRRPEDAYGIEEARHRHVVTDDAGTQTVAAVFDSESDAGGAVTRLRAAGIPDRCIHVHPTATERRELQGYEDERKHFHESIKHLALPEEDTQTYVEAMTRGGYVVIVHDFHGSMHDTIVDVLDDDRSVDLDSRLSAWEASGWKGRKGTERITGTMGVAKDSAARSRPRDEGLTASQMAADPGRAPRTGAETQQRSYASPASMGQAGDADRGASAAGAAASGANPRDEGVIKVVDEDLAVGKRAVDYGSVRVRSYVREEPVSADVDLRAQRVVVDRRPVDRPVREGDLRDRSLEARETTEEAVVTKQAHVVEEIGLRKETDVRREHIEDTVHKTEVEIEDNRADRKDDGRR